MLSLESHYEGERLPMGSLSRAIKRKIKRKEQSLKKRCMKVWWFTNRLGEKFIFGRFGLLKEDNTIVTLAAYNNLIHVYLTI